MGNDIDGIVGCKDVVGKGMFLRFVYYVFCGWMWMVISIIK